MRIARFNTGTIFSSWSNLAVASTLRAMGHEVFEGVVPTYDGGAVMHQLSPHQYRRTVAAMPTLEQLQDCDVIIVSGPEYLAAWLHTLYGKEAWRRLAARKVAFYLETTSRKDAQHNYAEYAEWYDVHFFPDPEDAARLNGHHMLASVDIEMFKPCEGQLVAKRYDAGFVGSLYSKRLEFLCKLLPLIPEIEFQAGGVAVRDLSGECQRAWAELLVSNIRQIRVHVGLPSHNSNIMTARPVETLACGTFLLTYRTSDFPLRDGEHCRMYDPEKPEELAELIRYYLAHEDEREAIAAAGLEEMRRNYSTRTRMEQVLAIACRD